MNNDQEISVKRSCADSGTEEAAFVSGSYQPMGESPGILSTSRAILRYPGRIIYEMQHGDTKKVVTSLLAVSAVCLLFYGVIVGMFSWSGQIWAAPLKILIGALLSSLVCLPSLVIFSYMSGLDLRLQEMCGLLAGMVTLVSLLLVGFGPVAWIFSQSTGSVCFMGFLHLVFWIISVFYGLRFLSAVWTFLRGQKAHLLAFWGFIFILVTLQMTTTLRPIIGTSEQFFDSRKKFFTVHWAECIDENQK